MTADKTTARDKTGANGQDGAERAASQQRETGGSRRAFLAGAAATVVAATGAASAFGQEAGQGTTGRYERDAVKWNVQATSDYSESPDSRSAMRNWQAVAPSTIARSWVTCACLPKSDSKTAVSP